MAKIRPLSEENVLAFLEAGNRAAPDVHPSDPLTPARKRVTLEQLRPYDRNPRQSRNPKFESILASIESRGLDHPPNISRRHPEDTHYLIIDGGNTRLEILNLLFDKYRRLAEQATTAAARQAHQETARSFQVLDCIFKPWRSESDTLAGHMSENEERGDTLFIEKALAVQQFREVYQEEDYARAEATGIPFDGQPLTIRALAERITAQGWTVSNSHISRLDYAASQLLPAIPNALWAGAGEPLVRNLRRLEKGYGDFWATTARGGEAPEAMTELFFEVLAEHNDDRIDLDGFTRTLDRAVGQRLGLSSLTVGAEVGAVMAGITRPPVPSVDGVDPDADLERGQATDQATGHGPERGAMPPRRDPAPSSRPVGAITTASTAAAPAITPAPAPVAPASSVTPTPPLPDTVAATHRAIIQAVAAVAQPYDLMVGPVTVGDYPHGCDWFVMHPINARADYPVPGLDDARAAVWWILFRVSCPHCQLDDATLDKTFADSFRNYFKRGRSALNIALLLREQEALLPEATQHHLMQLQQLIRHGTGLIHHNNGKTMAGGDDQ